MDGSEYDGLYNNYSSSQLDGGDCFVQHFQTDGRDYNLRASSDLILTLRFAHHAHQHCKHNLHNLRLLSYTPSELLHAYCDDSRHEMLKYEL